jgi:signal transduction histidine kinase
MVWFWPAVFVLFAVMIVLIIRVRMLRRALNMQTLRNNISADMHDEIGSTLSSISFYSQALLMQINDERHTKVLEKIKENAQNAQEGMSDIIWSVKASMDGMENVFNRMQSFGTEFLEAKASIFISKPIKN